MTAHPVFLMVIAIAPAVAILIYYLRLVRFAPEPWSRVVACCVAGGVCFVLAAQLQHALRPLIPRIPWLWALTVVAPSEELLKLLAVLVAAPRPTRYERVSSGLMYGVAVGAAFACVENIAYVTQFGAVTGVMRAATAVPSHVLNSAIVGLGIGLVHRIPDTGRRVANVAGAFMTATLLHGAYDALLLGVDELRGLAVVVLLVEAVGVHFGGRRVLERDLQRDIDMLKAVPMFDAVPAAAMRIIAAGSTRQRIDGGAAVVKQGHAGDAMFQIMRGELEARIDGKTVSTMHAGDFFGELALLMRANRTADVVATQDSLLLRVPRELLMRALHGNVELAHAVVERARTRFEQDVVPSAEALLESAAEIADADRIEGLAAQLATTTLLAGLPADDLAALAKACVTVNRGTGAKLVRARRQGPGLCVLLSGQAIVTFEGKTLTRLAEGDFFGEISLLTGWTASATVTATSPVELAALRWIDLEQILARNPAIGRVLLDSVEARLARDRGGAQRGSSPLRLALGRIGRAVNPLDAETETFYQRFPEIRSLPRSAVETVRALAQPADSAPRDDAGADVIHLDDRWKLSEQALVDGIARSPSIVRFLARQLLTSDTTV